MKTEAEFIRRFHKHLAGGFLFGAASEMKDGTLRRASRALEIPEETRKLLVQMYRFLAEDETPAPSTNGKVPAANGAAHPRTQ